MAGYEQQVAPGDSTPLPSPNPGGFTGAVPQLAAVGEQMTSDEQRMRQLKLEQQQDQQSVDSANALADAQGQMATSIANLRIANSANPDRHLDAVRAQFEQDTAPLLDGISNPKVRRSVQMQIASMQGSLMEREATWAAGQRVDNLVTGAKTLGPKLSNLAGQAPGQVGVWQGLSEQYHTMTADLAIPQDKKDALNREQDQETFKAGMYGTIADNPDKAIFMLNHGSLDAILEPEQIEALRNKAEVEQHWLQAQAEHVVAQQKAAVGQQKELLQARIEAGDVPADADLAAAAAASKAVGDKAGAFRLDVARQQVGLNRATQPWLPDQYNQAITALVAKGDKRTTGENVMLDQLQKIAPGRIRAFNDDPGSWAALNGNPRPQMDLSDPQSISANRQWRGTVLKATGRAPAPLPDEMARDLAQEAGQGPAGQLDVANRLAMFGGQDAIQAARQVAPSDPMLGRLTMLNPGDRAAAINGVAARKAHPALVDGQQEGANARETFDGLTGGALALMAQTDVGTAFDAGRNIFADGAVKSGQQLPGSSDAPRLLDAYQRALGATKDAQGRQHGGIGQWGNAKVLLPARATQDDFDKALNTRAWWGKDWAHAPVWTNGVAMTPDELRRFTPVARPDGSYEFHNARGEVVHGRGGGIWRLDIGSLIK